MTKGPPAHIPAAPSSFGSVAFASELFGALVAEDRVGGSGDLPEENRDRATDERCDEEQPHLLHRLAAGEQRRTQRACRVHRRAGERDAYEVDRCKRATDRQSRESGSSGVVGDQQDHSDECRGEQGLGQECAEGVGAVPAESVGAQAAGLVRNPPRS